VLAEGVETPEQVKALLIAGMPNDAGVHVLAARALRFRCPAPSVAAESIARSLTGSARVPPRRPCRVKSSRSDEGCIVTHRHDSAPVADVRRAASASASATRTPATIAGPR
jgi:hypothetical protein